MSALVFLLAVLVSPPPAEASRALNGVVYYEPSGWVGSLLNPSIGTHSTPDPDGLEIRDALAQFKDPKAARAALFALKDKLGAPNGQVFALFRYVDSENDDWGDLNMLCGVSREEKSLSPDVLMDHSAKWSFDPQSDVSYASFKRSTREMRVRSIARCLEKLPGMPALKPVPAPRIRALHIEPEAYQAAETILKKLGPPGFEGARVQYREAFRCIVTRAARTLPEAIGDSVAVRAFQQVDVKAPWLVLSVLPSQSVEDYFSTPSPQRAAGLWASRAGLQFSSNRPEEPLTNLLQDPDKDLPACLKHAGLPPLPTPPPPPAPAAAPCEPGAVSPQPSAIGQLLELLFYLAKPGTPSGAPTDSSPKPAVPPQTAPSSS